jgi:hypothetical protein
MHGLVTRASIPRARAVVRTYSARERVLQSMLLFAALARTCLMFNRLRRCHAQRALLAYHHRFRWGLLLGALALALVTPSAGAAEELVPVPGRAWEAGVRKSFFMPALEIGGFIFGLNQIDRHFIDAEEYGSDAQPPVIRLGEGQSPRKLSA